MVTGDLIQSRINRGLAIAASRAGTPFDLYRPQEPRKPLSLLNRIATVPAVFDASRSYAFKATSDYSEAVWSAIVDGDAVQVGDYLVGAPGTWFIIAMPPLLPILAVQCNAVVELRRMPAAQGVGNIGYRSDVPAGEQAAFSGYPASVLRLGTTRRANDGLPGEGSSAEFQVLLPAVPGASQPRPGDVLVDDASRRHAVTWCEATSLGWRLGARLLTAAA